MCECPPRAWTAWAPMPPRTHNKSVRQVSQHTGQQQGPAAGTITTSGTRNACLARLGTTKEPLHKNRKRFAKVDMRDDWPARVGAQQYWMGKTHSPSQWTSSLTGSESLPEMRVQRWKGGAKQRVTIFWRADTKTSAPISRNFVRVARVSEQYERRGKRWGGWTVAWTTTASRWDEAIS